jgi:hypothetical protein
MTANNTVKSGKSDKLTNRKNSSDYSLNDIIVILFGKTFPMFIL